MYDTSVASMPGQTEIVSESAIDCLAKAFSLSGMPATVSDIAKSKRFSMHQADMLHILAGIVEDFGLKCEVVTQLSAWQLEQSHFPVILHVSGMREGVTPDYFVLFLGARNGQALIYVQAGREVRSIPFDFLASRWNGEGVIVAPSSQQDVESLVVARWRQPGALAMVGTAAIFLALASRRRPSGISKKVGISTTLWNTFKMALFQATSLFSVAIIICILVQSLGANSVIAAFKEAPNRAEIRELGQAGSDSDNIASVISDIDLLTALKLHEAGILFVDARDPDEYLKGHILGAIDVPVGSPDRIRLGLSGIAINRKMVVYCGKATCPKAHTVAQIIHQLGYTNVSVYVDGFARWPDK